MTQSRQLAAIMFTDIVGYTALMGKDEKKALDLLKKNRENQKVIIEQFNGHCVKELGDGILASFKSVSNAVKAAIKIQETSIASMDFQLRIGIHLGEVVFENDDVYGDGVNIASRIESFAVPGSIFISDKVNDYIKNQPDIQTMSLGKYVLKNVKESVELYAISNPGLIIPDNISLNGKGEKEEQECILVLPFVNISNDPEQEYFSDGLTEELITSLSRLNEMKVISRTTSMKYKGTTKDIKTIGLETGAGYIMEGSVRNHGNNLRITAQFLDANRDIHLWADNYRGTLDDIFDIQEKVSEKIVEALRIQLTRNEKNTLQKRYTENTEAYQLYLQGRFFWNKRTEEGLYAALTHFEKAIEKDPDYALAWAGLSDTYNLLGEFTNLSRRDLHPKAKAAVSKALELDNQLAEAHISLASIYMLNEWDWVNSGKEYKIGISLNPNYATGHHWYAEWLLFMGKKEEALQEISLAVEKDPVSQAILKDQGMILYYTRHYDKAIEQGIKVLNQNPDFINVYRLLSLAYQGLGLYDMAIKENQRWGDHTRNKVKTDISLAQIYAASGQIEEVNKILAEVEDEYILTGNDYRGMALVYAALNETDKAFEWLDKSFERHEESLCALKVDPKLDNLRADPRFNLLVKKIGLEE